MFLPFSTSRDLKMGQNGSMDCWGDSGNDDPEGNTGLNADCVWIQYWVQLDTPAKADAYRRYLVNYSDQQRASGRYERPTNVRLRNVMEWLDFNKVVPSDVRLQVWLAFGFLLVCLLNTVGLLLAKFLRRSGEVGVRRALGASRREIFMQCLVEAGTVGVAGGIVGLGLAWLGLWAVRQQPASYAELAHLDPVMLLTTFVLAVVASLLAGTGAGLAGDAGHARHAAQVAITLRSAPASNRLRRIPMELRPILSTLLRHKTAASLIVLEIALSCAIICNALFLIGNRIERINLVSGVAENEVVRVQLTGIGEDENAAALTQSDLATLRGLPGVKAATVTNQVPFVNSSWNTSVTMVKDQKQPTLSSTVYMGEDQFVDTLGLKLVAGRKFTSDEFIDWATLDAPGSKVSIPSVIITRSMADKLFPGQDADRQVVLQLGRRSDPHRRRRRPPGAPERPGRPGGARVLDDPADQGAVFGGRQLPAAHRTRAPRRNAQGRRRRARAQRPEPHHPHRQHQVDAGPALGLLPPGSRDGVAADRGDHRVAGGDRAGHRRPGQFLGAAAHQADRRAPRARRHARRRSCATSRPRTSCSPRSASRWACCWRSASTRC